MKRKVSKNENGSMWCFAIVNGKLSEIYFDKNKKGKPEIHSHCYVKRNEYSKKEQKMIDIDIKKHHFTWRNGIYK
ncbi:MAG: hypothetical protein V1690_00390 [Candidatus Moraniibacteriota bacterium]